MTNEAGKVVRRCGVRGDGGTWMPAQGPAVSLGEKEKMRAMFGSAGPADSGGVAVMVLGKFTSLETVGERGWAVKGVSR